MNRTSHVAEQPNSARWKRRLVNALGMMLVTLVIVWATEFSPVNWWNAWRDRQPKSIEASLQPPRQALGIAPPAPQGNDSSVSKVPIPLLLVHVSPGATEHDGTAEIGVVRESPQTYQAGALLENGARLAELYPDHVVLEKYGRTVRLYLDNINSGQKSESPLLNVGGALPTTAVPITSREVITDYLRPNPVYSADTLVGFQVYPGSKPGPFYQMGLRAGDVITEIGGMPLTESAGAWDLLRQVAQGSTVSASIDRSGVTLMITLDGGFIVSAEDQQQQQAAQAVLMPNTR